jgi:predicted DNA-binding transcriptional regulator AlpA
MAKRKPDATVLNQLDMFSGWGSGSNEPTKVANSPLHEPEPFEAANDQATTPDIDPENPSSIVAEQALDPTTLEPAISATPTISQPKLLSGWENDEWWTTAMVCAYLKLGRKAIWERTRNPKIGFPKPTHFGSCRHRWQAGEVRAWAEGKRPGAEPDCQPIFEIGNTGVGIK